MNENTRKYVEDQIRDADFRLNDALENLREELAGVNSMRGRRGIIEPRRYDFLAKYATDAARLSEKLWALASVKASDEKAES